MFYGKSTEKKYAGPRLMTYKYISSSVLYIKFVHLQSHKTKIK